MTDPTLCQCTNSGWCSRHQVHKTDKQISECQKGETLWQAWERGRGPGQPIYTGRKRIIGPTLQASLSPPLKENTMGPIPVRRVRRSTLVTRLGAARILDETDLVRDSVALAGHILRRWPNVDGIAGVPRSGMIAASVIATTLGVPLYELYQGELRRLGGGRRMRRQLSGPEGTNLVAVEDSINTGWSLNRAVGGVPDPRIIGRSAVYCTPTGTPHADVYSVLLPLPHYFTWHMFGSNILSRQPTGFDMDGIYCEDCPKEDDDDGERYLEWMRNVRPFRIYTGGKATAIVTARLEKYRSETEQWLHRYDIEYGQLIMGPWSTIEERRRSSVADWKSSVCNQLRLDLFVESSEGLAVRIAASAGIPVMCPEAKKVFLV